jgi:predicted transcriptional regulator
MHWYVDPQELKKRRKAVGLTQADLARLSGVKRSMIAAVEAGWRPLDAEVGGILWRAIADAYIDQAPALVEMLSMV